MPTTAAELPRRDRADDVRDTTPDASVALPVPTVLAPTVPPERPTEPPTVASPTAASSPAVSTPGTGYGVPSAAPSASPPRSPADGPASADPAVEPLPTRARRRAEADSAAPEASPARPRRVAGAPSAEYRPGALRLTPTSVPDPRTTIVEKIAFGLAVVVAPLGLLASIAAAVVSARRRGWVPSLVSAGIVVGFVLTLVGAGGLAVGNSYAAEAIRQRALEARSQPLCRTIQENGLDASGADFGWPDPGDSIDATVASIRAYADRWQSAADVAPPAVRAGASQIATAANEIAAGVAQNRTISDAANTSRLQSLRAQSPVPGWVATYCR